MTQRLTPKQKRAEILRLLSKLTDQNHSMFKRMYSHNNLDKDISDIVNNMPAKHLDIALGQCKNTYYSFFEKMKK